MCSTFMSYFRLTVNVNTVARVRNAVIFLWYQHTGKDALSLFISFPHIVKVHIHTELKLGLKKSVE